MSDCPAEDRLLRLLEDDLSEGEHAELTAHLEACQKCRGVLDRLAARSGLWDALPLLRHDASGLDTRLAGEDLARSSPDDNDDLPLDLLEPPDDPEHLGKLGPYDVIRLLGRGGMGLVFLARDRALDRLVAIKILSPGLAATASARRRFGREARAAAAVAHEHVVTIHAVDSLPQGVPYLVMQYVAGKSVQDVIDRGKGPELAEILRIGSQAAGALAAAHAQGLIHRDIKPANILLEDGLERVKITDFGLARAVDDATLSQSGVVAGTPQYMSPEQACGEPVDHRTDLFSLGSVLYALCTGQAAFRGSSSMATLRKVCEQKPRPIQELNPEIPSWLVRIIEKLHAKDADGRYGSAAEVADLLCRCLAHVQQPGSVPLPDELRPARNPRRMALWASLPFVILSATILCWPAARQVAGQAVSYMGTVLRLTTPEGILVIEADDPDVGIRLDGSDLVVTGAGLKEVRLPVGRHSVQALKDGRPFRNELVTISRGGRTILRVRREKEAETPPSMATIPDGKVRDEAAFLTSPPPVDADPIGVTIEPERTAPIGTLGPVGSEVRTVSFSPDGRVVALGTKAGRVGLWDWRSQLGGGGESLPQASFEAHPGGVEGVAISPGGRTLVTGGQDHHVRLWEMKPHLPPTKPTWDFDRFHAVVRSVAFSPDGNLVAAGGFDKTLTVLDAKDGRPVWTSPILDQPVNGIAFSPDGHQIALAMGDYSKGTPGDPNGQPGEVQVWNWPGRERIATMVGWRRECKSVAFNSTGQYLAASSGDGSLRLYACDRGSCKERCVLDGGPWSAGVAFLPGSFLLANSNWSGQVRFWDATTQKLGDTLQAHGENIPCIAFSPDGRALATAGSDGMVKLWDFSRSMAAPVASGAGLDPRVSQEVQRLAVALKSHAPRAASRPGAGMRLYMRDLVDGWTTPIFDSSTLGRPYAEVPSWSFDGRQILFHIQPRKNDWRDSRVLAVERRDGVIVHRDLGAGCCASLSPDGQTIAFSLLPDQVAGAVEGVWLMNADGTDRRRVCQAGSPSWSPDGTRLLLNQWNESKDVIIYTLATKQVSRVGLSGLRLYSWPRWAGPNRLVACINGGKGLNSLVLFSLGAASEARVERMIWNRLEGPDVIPRWPLVSASGSCFFIGVEENLMRRTIFELVPESSVSRRLESLDEGGPRLSGLNLSPDGRYLIFAADHLNPKR